MRSRLLRITSAGMLVWFAGCQRPGGAGVPDEQARPPGRTSSLSVIGPAADKPTLYVSFTMDCERIGEECMAGGPKDWELSERAIRGYCTRLLDAGIPPTLFIVPETGQRHAALFRELEARGAELGMHLHPQCFQDHRYDRYLGEYDAAMQREILGQGVAMLEAALGTRPRAFRGGNFSANDDTYDVLIGLGFRQGSLADPGRRAPQYHAMWEGVEADVHWANLESRLPAGDSVFMEAPLTTDPERRHSNGFPYELRIESGEFEQWHLPIIRGALQRMEREGVGFRALSIFTHNYFAYDDEGDAKTRTVNAYIAWLKGLEAEYDVVPVTLATMREAFVRHVGKREVRGGWREFAR